MFSAKSAEFVLRLEKFPFLSESSSKSDASNGKKIFCSSKGSGDIHQKRSLKKQLDSFFCESLYNKCKHCYEVKFYPFNDRDQLRSDATLTD